MLTESEEKLNILKESLTKALGNNGEVITNIIPNLVSIIGSQPPLAELPPTENLNRFLFTFQKFIHTFAHVEHPLILFLDDLQWSDSASLALIKLLLMDNELNHFIMIGAYRDNEVSSNHPLTILQLQLKQANIPFKHLTLSPLDNLDIEHLLKDSFAMQEEQISPLADLIHNKTQGNPFFINEFLKKLYQEKLLIYSYKDNLWFWSINQIRNADITDNVIDLLISRIYSLPETTQKLLKMASCIGHSFDLSTLSIICEQSLNDTAKEILDAIQANFIVVENDKYRLVEGISNSAVEVNDEIKKMKYRFVHDKVQQAAYQLIPESIKQELHLKIGRLLLKDNQLGEKDENLFDILNHFNNCLNQITDHEEKLKLAKYNLWAGKKAKTATAFQAAREYFEAGVFLLDISKSEVDNDLFYALTKELAACQYLTGDFEKAESCFKQLLTLAKETLSTIEIYKINCEMLATLNKHKEALQLGLKVLSSIKIYIPKNPTKLNLLWEIFKIKFLVGRRNIKEINISPITSKKYHAAIELISQLLNSAFIVNQDLFVLLACIKVRLSIRYGYSESTSFSCLVYAFSIMHGLNRYKEGIAFSELYLNIKNKSLSHTQFEGKNCFVMGCFIDPWRLPLEESLKQLFNSFQFTYDAGDIVYSNYCNLMIIFTQFMVGKPISEVKNSAKNAINFITKTKTNDFYLLAKFWEYGLECLVNNIFSFEKLGKFEQDILANKNNTEICTFYVISTKFLYLLGHYKEAQLAGWKHLPYAQYLLGFVTLAEGDFYFALSLFAKYPTEKKLSTYLTLRKIHRRFQKWASWCPKTFYPYLLLLEAEFAKINKNILLAMKLYHQSIEACGDQTALLAVINECICRFYFDLGYPEIAKIYIMSAQLNYHSLGAIRKSELINENYPTLFQITSSPPLTNDLTTQNSTTSIDMLSLMKSAQILSDEIQLDKLLQKLLIILLQNAGAHRGVLVTKVGDNWFVEAEGTTEAQRVILSQTERVENRTDLPLTLIRYVQRTMQTVLLQSTQDFESFIDHDDYLSKIKPQSILFVPIFYQGNLQSILYLENKIARQAFNREHVNILQILSSQAAISMQNARLYYQATHDQLTGLSNRNLLYQMFNLAAGKSKRTFTIIAFLFLDIDLFKKINDTLGHEIGDMVLLNVAERLKVNLRDGDLAVRLGGDEFVVMMIDTEINQTNHIATRLLEHIKEPMYIQGHEIHTSVSIGISLFPENGSDIDELLKHADIALYRVKATERGSYRFYTSILDQQLREENRMEIELREAIENNQLYLVYQPVYTAKKHQLTHFEALVRWQHPVKGVLKAESFIPLAEKTELILLIGEFVLEKVFEQIKRWKNNKINFVPIAVNVSGVQFKKQSISKLISKLIQMTQIDASYLQLEFTESVYIEYTASILEDINALKKLGIKLILDDFGTYFSSLSYLRQTVVDKIKIDQSFINGIDRNEKGDRELITAIILMAHSLGLTCVAEGVENKIQMDFLEEHYIDELQGYYLGHPMNIDECTDLLNNISSLQIE